MDEATHNWGQERHRALSQNGWVMYPKPGAPADAAPIPAPVFDDALTRVIASPAQEAFPKYYLVNVPPLVAANGAHPSRSVVRRVRLPDSVALELHAPHRTDSNLRADVATWSAIGLALWLGTVAALAITFGPDLVAVAEPLAQNLATTLHGWLPGL